MKLTPGLQVAVGGNTGVRALRHAVVVLLALLLLVVDPVVALLVAGLAVVGNASPKSEEMILPALADNNQANQNQRNFLHVPHLLITRKFD